MTFFKALGIPSFDKLRRVQKNHEAHTPKGMRARFGIFFEQGNVTGLSEITGMSL